MRAKILFVMCLMMLIGCAGKPPELTPISALPLEDDAVPVLIDTDMGTDDAMAILYLLGRPDVDVKAITVGGNGLATCAAGVENARGLTLLAGRPEIPVACDNDSPLEGDHKYPDFMRDGAGNLGGMVLPENTTDATDLSGVELIAQTVAAHDDLSILSLGALTNLAEYLTSNPDAAARIRMIYVMGGAVNVDGNTNIPGVAGGNKFSEFNIWVDPTAAQMVFASGAPITLVPLDATNTVPLNTDFMNTLKADQGESPAIFVYEMLNRNQAFILSGGYYFWDPLAAAILTDESLATLETMRIDVITEGDEIGRTIESEDGSEMQVAVDADEDRFIELFIDVLNGRTSPED